MTEDVRWGMQSVRRMDDVVCSQWGGWVMGVQSVGRMDDVVCSQWGMDDVCSQWGGWVMGYAVSGEGG